MSRPDQGTESAAPDKFRKPKRINKYEARPLIGLQRKIRRQISHQQTQRDCPKPLSFCLALDYISWRSWPKQWIGALINEQRSSWRTEQLKTQIRSDLAWTDCDPCRAHGLASKSSGTWRWLNRHSLMNEIEHADPNFWPDCLPWTKNQTIHCLNKRT